MPSPLSDLQPSVEERLVEGGLPVAVNQAAGLYYEDVPTIAGNMQDRSSHDPEGGLWGKTLPHRSLLTCRERKVFHPLIFK